MSTSPCWEGKPAGHVSGASPVLPVDRMAARLHGAEGSLGQSYDEITSGSPQKILAETPRVVCRTDPRERRVSIGRSSR